MADEFELDAESFFTATGWKTRIFGRKRRALRDLQGVYLVGTELTDDTKSITNPFDTNGRLKVSSIPGAGVNAWTGTGVTILDGQIGDWASLDSGLVAGNVAVSLPLTTPTASQLWEVRQIAYSVTCDGTAATRTPLPQFFAGMPNTVQTSPQDFILANSLPSLTASQTGRVFVPLAPALVQLNDNGVITTGNTSPLPVLIDATTFTMDCTLTAGVAGDRHRMTAWCRRVA